MCGCHTSVRVAIFVVALGVPVARSQQQENGQGNLPAPASYSPFTAKQVSLEDTNANPQQLVPDTRALAGARELSLGAPGLTRSFWQPFFGLMLTVDTNPLTAIRSSGLTTWSSLFGGIDVRRILGRSDLTLNYVGGGLTADNTNSGASLVQQLEFSEKLTYRRTVISFLEQLSYLPEPAFGSYVSGGQSFSDAQGLSLQPALIPNQSILTTRGRRISQSFLTEIDRLLTPRSSVTFVGSYSLLRFLDNGFLNSGDTLFQVGYNYQLTPKDTIALLYRFTTLRFNNFDQSIHGHVAQVAFGRRITGRLAFHAEAGPEVAFFRTPVSTSMGTSGGSTTTTNSSARAYWTLDTSMTYERWHTQFGLAYDHSLSGGAGVLAGAVNDQVSGSINRRYSRSLDGGFVFGYARNEGLNVPTQAPSKESYTYWFSGVNVSHPWGRWANVFMDYRLQFQKSNASFCVGATCGESFVRHTISIGFGWRPRPIPIQ